MEQEDTIDFKTLRAKFQDEAAVKQMMNKPTVPQKPKQIPPPGARNSLLTSINTAVENKMPVMPRVIFKDENKRPDSKQPSFLPTSPKATADVKELSFNAEEVDHKQKKEGEAVNQAVSDRKLSPVPLTPTKKENPEPEPKLLPPDKTTPPKQPLNSTKALKADTEFPVITECPPRFRTTPEPEGEAVKKNTTEAPKFENGIPTNQISEVLDPQSPKPSNSGSHIPDVIPPVCKTTSCDRRVLKALEKAKKKVSPHQTLLSSMPKSTPHVDEDPSNTLIKADLHPELPPIDYENSLQMAPAKHTSNIAPVVKLNGTSQSLNNPVLEAIAAQGPAFQSPDLGDSVNDETGFEVSEFIPPEYSDFQMPHYSAAELQTTTAGVSEPETMEYWPEEYETSESQDPNHGFLDHEYPPAPEAQSPGPMALQFIPEEPAVPRASDAVNEEKSRKRQNKSKNAQKSKAPPKNPYAEAHPTGSDSNTSSLFHGSRQEKSDRKGHSEGPDDKELKKKEKQRLEKEKKEQKEREKKENEMKKRFKITGQEEIMYQAKVTVANKGSKNDLAVKSGDIISIIRTNNCPKGKWLARDCSNKYGYIPVKSLELDIQEMLEIGKKAAQAAGRTTVDGETTSTGSRASNHYPLSTGSFTDDSEEWTGDDEDHLSPTDSRASDQPFSVPETKLTEGHFSPQQDGGVGQGNVQLRKEALEKLATFFHQRAISDPVTNNLAIAPSPATPSSANYDLVSSHISVQEEDTQVSDAMILPPPELYADTEN